MDHASQRSETDEPTETIDLPVAITDLDDDDADLHTQRSTDVHTVLRESGGVGGADNTAEPVGGNFSHIEPEGLCEQVYETPSARQHFQAGDSVDDSDCVAPAGEEEISDPTDRLDSIDPRDESLEANDPTE